MKELFIATNNKDLGEYILLLLKEIYPEKTWNSSEKFSTNLDLLIYDVETIPFSEFEKYQSKTPVLLYCHSIEPYILQYTNKFFINGIMCFEMKKSDIEKTFNAVQNNDIFFSDKMISILFSNSVNEQSSKITSLTERENEILLMMMNDMTNEDIANELHVSVRTINAHKGNIMRKVGAKTTSGLIKLITNYSAVLRTQL